MVNCFLISFFIVFRGDDTRSGIVAALKNLLTESQLETGNQYLKLVPGNTAETELEEKNADTEPATSSEKTRFDLEI